MSKLKISKFDASEYLDSPEMIAEYLNMALNSENPTRINQAIGNIAKARGMTELSGQTGIPRNTLYRLADSKNEPKFSTIKKLTKSLGLSIEFKTV